MATICDSCGCDPRNPWYCGCDNEECPCSAVEGDEDGDDYEDEG